MGLPIRLAARFISQKTGSEDVFCCRCKAKVTFKWIGTKGDHTFKCKCGVSSFKNRDKDKFHVSDYSTYSFIPAKKYKPNFKDLDFIEKEGYNKIIDKNGKKVYVHGSI